MGSRSFRSFGGDDELVVRLNSTDLKLLDLDLSDPKCVILASSAGAAADWNQRSPNQIFPFDRIVTCQDLPHLATLLDPCDPESPSDFFILKYGETLY